MAQEDIFNSELLQSWRRKTFPIQNYSNRGAGRHFQLRIAAIVEIGEKLNRFLSQTLRFLVNSKKNSHFSAAVLCINYKCNNLKTFCLRPTHFAIFWTGTFCQFKHCFVFCSSHFHRFCYYSNRFRFYFWNFNRLCFFVVIQCKLNRIYG